LDTIIKSLYYSYAKYVNTSKMIPSILDGLIPIHRRLLLTVHRSAKNKFEKTVKILGNTSARLHPYALAEVPIQTLVSNGLVHGSGQWGLSMGIEKTNAAAPRYTSVKSNPFIEKIAFEYIDYVDWIDGELDGEEEPISLPTTIPLCLISKFDLNTIAFGFKVDLPTYKIEDLVKRLLFLIGESKEDIFIKPSLPGCIAISDDKLYKKLLKDGSAKIEFKGEYYNDNKNFDVMVKGFDNRTSFEKIWNKIDRYKKYNLASDGNISFVDETGDEKEDDYEDLDIYTEKPPRIRISVTRKRNKKKMFDQMVDAVDNALTFTRSYNIMVVEDDTVKSIGVDDFLLSAYNHFKAAKEKYHNLQIESLNKKIKELNIVGKIRPYISHLSETGWKDEYIDDISHKIYESREDIENIINKYKIKKLLTVELDIHELENKVKDNESKLKNINNECVKIYNDIIT